MGELEQPTYKPQDTRTNDLNSVVNTGDPTWVWSFEQLAKASAYRVKHIKNAVGTMLIRRQKELVLSRERFTSQETTEFSSRTTKKQFKR